jgi:UDP-N-acetylmuramoylalanine--D-glutamate ligase
MKKTLILGFGVSGKATAKLLESRKMPYVAVDRNGPIFDTPDFPLEEIEQIVLSPGVAPTHPILVRARKCGIGIVGEVEFAFRFIKNRCIGVTGSNGKTTTCQLIAHALKARAVGNIGAAISEYAVNPDPDEILVVELSSFQLETLVSKKLEVAVVLNITANHMDRYASMEEYARAKGQIQHCAKKMWISKQVSEKWGSLFPGAEIFDLATIVPEEYIQLGAVNAFAAEKVCRYFGATGFFDALKTFVKPPHRVELVCERDGVAYYNDSKATSIEAVLHGISLMNRPVILIAGGVHKGSSYAPWIPKFKGKVKTIVAYGQAAAILEAELGPHFPVIRVEPFDEAVKIAQNFAQSGDAVLLSPGCSSYDQFKSYEHRGDAFKGLVL